MQDHSPRALQTARRLRGSMSLPEVLLWRHLRGKPMAVRFRRQHPIGDYVLDFYCPAAGLAVEIDGMSHDEPRQAEHDAQRDAWLASRHIRVVRIPAREALNDPAAVAESVVRLCAKSPPPPALRAATSPSGGGSKRAIC